MPVSSAYLVAPCTLTYAPLSAPPRTPPASVLSCRRLPSARGGCSPAFLLPFPAGTEYRATPVFQQRPDHLQWALSPAGKRYPQAHSACSPYRATHLQGGRVF